LFSYYGRKTKVVKYYPEPRYDTIIEPFAGSAVYSLYGDNWKKKVILMEKYDKVVEVWKYLLSVSEEHLLSLPDTFDGTLSECEELSTAERYLIGYCLNRGSAVPKQRAGMYSDWPRNKREIASGLYKIRHWDIRHGDYRELDNIEATWFIDPPYQFGGEYYALGNGGMDYPSLSEWCGSRNGQVIVCENTKANWMPFRPLKQMRGNKHVTTEAIWTNDDPSTYEYAFPLSMEVQNVL
jgi:hypothetical protein